MIDIPTFLGQLHRNLNLLREREAKYGGHAPLELINQIDDHKKAITLTEQAGNGEIDEAAWLDALPPLLIGRSDWLGINLALQLVLAQYAAEQGAALARRAGPQASARAGEIMAVVLAHVAAVDPRTAQKYPANPTGYQAPLHDVLDEILAADQSLVGQLKTMLEQYQTAVAARSGQSAGLQARLSGSGVISQQSSQTAGERGVVGSSAGGDIITGDGNVPGDASPSRDIKSR